MESSIERERDSTKECKLKNEHNVARERERERERESERGRAREKETSDVSPRFQRRSMMSWQAGCAIKRFALQ